MIINLALIASTHFIPVSSDYANLREELKSLPKPTNMLIKHVADAWGTSVFPILSKLIVSTDDTTEYIFEGMCKKQPKFILATKSLIMKRGSNALYQVQDRKSMSGMRVKLTFTFTAMGNCFPSVVRDGAHRVGNIRKRFCSCRDPRTLHRRRRRERCLKQTVGPFVVDA